MKKLILAFLTLVAVMALCLTSCEGDKTPDKDETPEPHTHTPSEWITDTEPTCKVEGTKHKECTECEEVLETGSIDKLAHTPSEWITDTEPTCKVEGTKHKECTECEEVLETGKVDKLEHNYSTEFVFNATHHYYECTCGLRSNEATHISSGAPTSHNDEVCTVCGYVINEAVGIKFNTLNVNGNKVNGKVSNETEYYTFIDEITTVGGATYIISDNISGKDPIVAQTIDLVTGDNTVYVIEFIDGEPTNVYIVTIRRRPMYDVTFNTVGGTAVEHVTVEEDTILTAPQTTRAGYTFAGWDYDFTQPITQSFTATASWTAHTDTSYRVEYYLENVEKTGYDILDSETETLKGTTGTTVNAEQKTFDHFTLNTQKSTLRGNINGDGSLVLRVYYTRDTYKVSVSSVGASVSGAGTYPYGTNVTVTVNSVYLGYDYVGIYSGEVLLTKDSSCTFTIDDHIVIKVDVIEEMRNFAFASNKTFCTITGIIDKTVEEIIIPDYVTSISGGAFSDCSSLESITLPFIGATKDGTSNTHFGYIFGASKNGDNDDYVPSSLKTVIIGDSVTSIGWGAFMYCDSLTSVSIGDSVTSIGNYAFYNCSSLTSVSIGDSVTSIGGWAFNNCTSLTSITVDKNNTAYKDIDGNLYSKDGKTIIQYAIGKTDTNFTIPDSVTSIDYYAFAYCTSLTSVVIGDSVWSIGSDAFSNCSSLTSVVIPDSVTSIGSYAFNYCYKLVEVYNLSSLDITKGSDAYGRVGYYALNVYTPTSGESKLHTTTDGFVFYEDGNKCYLVGYIGNKTDITLPESYNGKNYKIYKYAFYYCSSLTSVSIGDSVTSIGYEAFRSCYKLVEVYNLSSLDITKGSDAYGRVGYYALNVYTPTSGESKLHTTTDGFVFYEDGNKCYLVGYIGNKTDITLPESYNGKNYEIYNYAFCFCDSLTSVSIGDGVTSIGEGAFARCSSLTSIKYRGTEAQWNAITKGDSWDYDTGNYTITYNYKGE